MAFTHWKKLENPDYIGAYAFQPGEEKVVTICRVQRAVVNGPDGKKEECTIVHFAEKEKPLILNATNGKMIEKLAGTPYVEQWVGVRIKLVVEKVKAFGDVVSAVRVKNEKLQQIQQQPEIPLCADCGGKIEGAGKANAAQIAAGSKKKFGVALCAACGAKRREAMDAAKSSETGPAQDEPEPDAEVTTDETDS